MAHLGRNGGAAAQGIPRRTGCPGFEAWTENWAQGPPNFGVGWTRRSVGTGKFLQIKNKLEKNKVNKLTK